MDEEEKELDEEMGGEMAEPGEEDLKFGDDEDDYDPDNRFT